SSPQSPSGFPDTWPIDLPEEKRGVEIARTDFQKKFEQLVHENQKGIPSFLSKVFKFDITKSSNQQKIAHLLKDSYRSLLKHCPNTDYEEYTEESRTVLETFHSGKKSPSIDRSLDEI